MANGVPHKNLGFINKAGDFELTPVTEEEIEEARAKAAKAISVIPDYSSMNPAEIAAHQAAYFREKHEQALMAKIVKHKSNSHPEVVAAKRALAVTIRAAGNQAEAFAMMPEDPKFLKGAEAVDKPEDEFCDCVPDTYKHVTGVTLTRPLYSSSPVMVGDEPKTLWRCLKCGFLNISNQIPPQMERIIQKKAAARRDPKLANEVFLLS